MKRRVFEIGLARTGTKSIAVAAEILGFRSAHGATNAREMHGLIVSLCTGRLRSKVIRNHNFVGGSVAKWYRELDAAYPDARFILTTREYEGWLRSCRLHWKKRDRTPKPAKESTANAPLYLVEGGALLRLAIYGCIDFRHQKFKQVWEDHHREVRAYFADRPDKLLEFDVTAGDGWPELCGFLGEPIPDVPFPHLQHRGVMSAKQWVDKFTKGEDEVQQ